MLIHIHYEEKMSSEGLISKTNSLMLKGGDFTHAHPSSLL